MLSPVLHFGVPVFPAGGPLSYAQVMFAVTTPEVALPFLIVQVPVVGGGLTLLLQPVLVDTHRADVVALSRKFAGIVWCSSSPQRADCRAGPRRSRRKELLHTSAWCECMWLSGCKHCSRPTDGRAL